MMELGVTGMKRSPIIWGIGGLGILLLACAPSPLPMPTEGVRDFVLETVTWVSPERLRVKGYFPNGCQVPVTVTPQQVGDRLNLEITRDLAPGAVCPAMIQPYETQVSLVGPWRSGQDKIHSVWVNGVAVPSSHRAP